MKRHDARVIAISALFCWELSKDVPDEIFDRVGMDFFSRGEEHGTEKSPILPSQDERFSYAFRLFKAAVSNVDKIDSMISAASQGWQISRMPKVDLSILRLAIAEFSYVGEVPLEVVLDEALELSKEYSTFASPRFVNGVLMGILREKVKSKSAE